MELGWERHVHVGVVRTHAATASSILQESLRGKRYSASCISNDIHVYMRVGIYK